MKKNYSWSFILKVGLKKTFTDKLSWLVTVMIALVVLSVYYLLLIQKTTWDAFLQSNTTFYIWGQVILSVINALLIGVAILTALTTVLERKKVSKGSFFQTLGSLVFSAAATGCSVCTAFLLPLLGIAATLTALPFGGLEIKFLSILILIYAIYENAKINSGICPIYNDPLITTKKNRFEVHLNKKTLSRFKPFVALFVFIIIVYSLPKLPSSWRLSIQKKGVSLQKATIASKQASDLFSQINPPQGYEINATFGDIGPKMVQMGVINLDKFKQVYQQSGSPLTQEQIDILTKGSNQKLKISPENSYFLLNLFWAFGLANKSVILTKGDIVKYGEGQVGNFASTGGWSDMTKSGNAMDYYSKATLAAMTPAQEKLVNDVASNIYRPCCGNSTAFPDCNHGMALLGILELMASQGATEQQMYQAAKYINSFWFPANAYDAALYFKNKEGVDFKNVDSKKFLSKDVFSAYGAQAVKNWLIARGLEQPPPKQGGGCGV